MKTWVRKSLNVGVLSAGFLLVAGTAAHADWTSGPNAGLLNGNQLSDAVQIPIDACGNAIVVGGFAQADCAGGATAAAGSGGNWSTGFNAGALNGNQLSNLVQVPLDVCGNSVAVLGFADASCTGGSSTSTGGGTAAGTGTGMGHGHGTGSGSGMGHGHGTGSGSGSGSGPYAENIIASGAGAAATEAGWTSGPNAGILSGNQISNVIQVPIDICGNALSLFGFASASCVGGASAGAGGASGSWSTGPNAGLLSGNQISDVIQVPIDVCGNSVAVLGFADASCTGGSSASTGGTGGGTGSGTGSGNGYGNGTGNGNGNYAGATGVSAGRHNIGNLNGVGSHMHGKGVRNIKVLSDPSAKAANVANEGLHRTLGQAHGLGAGHVHSMGTGTGTGTGTAAADAVSCGDMITGFNTGILSGNQIKNTIQIPIEISGNALALLGFAQASSTGGAFANAC